MTTDDNNLDLFFRHAEQDSETDLSAYAANWLTMQGMLSNKPTIPGKHASRNPGIFNIIIMMAAGAILVFTLTKISQNKTVKSGEATLNDTMSTEQIPSSKPLLLNDSMIMHLDSTGPKNEVIIQIMDTLPGSKKSLNTKPSTPSKTSIRFQQEKDTTALKRPDSLTLITPVAAPASSGELRVLEDAKFPGKRINYDFDTTVASFEKSIDSISTQRMHSRKKQPPGKMILTQQQSEKKTVSIKPFR